MLAEKLGFYSFHADSMTMNGTGFGNAILSRWPISDSKVITLSGTEETGETRNALYARIDGPRGPFDFFCTQINWRYEQRHSRQTQVRGHITDVEIIGDAPVDGVWPSDHFGVMAKIIY